MTSCTTPAYPGYLKFYLGIGIPVISVIFVIFVAIVYIVYRKRKQFNEALVLQNIADMRNNQKLANLSQKMFDYEISILKKININQITKGNQIGNIAQSIHPYQNSY